MQPAHEERHQDDIAAEANRIFENYARKADDIAKDHQREASKKVGALVEKLRKRIGSINESGLTPFAKEELDIVERRLNDVEHMVDESWASYLRRNERIAVSYLPLREKKRAMHIGPEPPMVSRYLGRDVA